MACTGQHHSVRPRPRSFTTFPLSANDAEKDDAANHDAEDDDDDDGEVELLPTGRLDSTDSVPQHVRRRRREDLRRVT